MKIEAQTRTVFGKHLGGLRKEGRVPAEVYGHGTDNMHLSIAHKDLAHALGEIGKTGIIILSVEGKDTRVMAHDWTHDVKTGDVQHIDFYAVKAGEKITAEIPFVFEGESQAVRDELGALVKNLHELQVEALPEKLPHEFVLDISTLTEVGSSFTAEDIKLPAGVELVTAPDTVIVSIAALQAEEVEETEEDLLEAVEVEGGEAAEDASSESQESAG